MKSFLLVLLFLPATFCFSQDSLGNALESLRAAEKEAERDIGNDEEFEEEEEEGEDWERLMEKVAPAQMRATLEKHFKTELGWLKELRGEDPEHTREAREMLEHAARETVVISTHEPEALRHHLRVTKAEIAAEYWAFQLFEGDNPKKAAAEYRKARRAIIDVEIAHLKEEIEHLQAELKEIDAEVEEMLLERGE